MRTKSDSADKVYSNRQTLRDCFMLRVLYTGKTKKNERLLKTKQCSAKSLSLFDFCFLERRILLEMERKQMFCRMISISQTCLYLIKFSVEVYLFQWTENWKYYFGKSIVRRIVQGRYWRDYKKLYTSMFHSYFNEYAFDDIFNVLNPIDN